MTDLPHSRACGIRPHPHGPLCARDCPTCIEVLKPLDELFRPSEELEDHLRVLPSAQPVTQHCGQPVRVLGYRSPLLEAAGLKLNEWICSHRPSHSGLWLTQDQCINMQSPPSADLEAAADWTDYRRDYGVPQEHLGAAHRAFLAGWRAGRHGEQSGVQR